MLEVEPSKFCTWDSNITFIYLTLFENKFSFQLIKNSEISHTQVYLLHYTVELIIVSWPLPLELNLQWKKNSAKFLSQSWTRKKFCSMVKNLIEVSLNKKLTIKNDYYANLVTVWPTLLKGVALLFVCSSSAFAVQERT